MITLRRAGERHHDRRRKQDAWFTFLPDRHKPAFFEFGTLQLLSEEHLPPFARARAHAPQDSEILTYVREGTLAFEDSLGRSGVIQAGEFQRMTAGHRVRHSEVNASETKGAHVFRLWLRPSEARLEPSYEQQRFSSGQRRGRFCAVASPDGRRGSLHVRQQAVVYSSILDAGQHMAQALASGRSAWLQVVHGEVALNGMVLVAGDGAGFTAEHAISLTARKASEILLIDVGELSREWGENAGSA